MAQRVCNERACLAGIVDSVVLPIAVLPVLIVSIVSMVTMASIVSMVLIVLIVSMDGFDVSFRLIVSMIDGVCAYT